MGDVKYGIWDRQLGKYCDGPFDSEQSALDDDLVNESLQMQYRDGNGGNDETPAEELGRQADSMTTRDLLEFFDYEIRPIEEPHTAFNVDEGIYIDDDQNLVWVTPDGMYDYAPTGATLTRREFSDRRMEPLYTPTPLPWSKRPER